MDLTFPWHTLRSIVAGDSAIDVPFLNVSSDREAEDFLEAYGFRWDRADQRLELEEIRAEAVAFVEEVLLEPEQVVLPEIREETDIRRLLCIASDRDRSLRQRWACAILRVMHTAAHRGSLVDERYGPAIRTQILDRFQQHVHPAGAGLTLGAGDESIPLVAYEPKLTKPRRSILLKLLHKVENVSVDVLDRVGVRFITRHRFDALLVVRYLRAHNVIMFANVVPTRSRNSLIDVGLLEMEMARLHTRVVSGEVPVEARLDRLRDAVDRWPLPQEPTRTRYNPYSSVAYHSIQFTCRQIIRVPDHLRPGSEHRFFFPFEVQVMDAAAYEASRVGLASYDDYKARQREAVRARVLGDLVRRPSG